MLHLAYHSNGLFSLPLHQAIEEVARAGYEGIDLTLSAEHLNPYVVTNGELDALGELLARVDLRPVCVDTGWSTLLSSVPFEPSLISPEAQSREERIRVIRRGLEIANYLGAPVVTFTSGVRHPVVSAEQASEWLREGVEACLDNTGDAALLIEPEAPVQLESGTVLYSFVERISEAIDLIDAVSSPRFLMATDICHAYCSEEDLLTAIAHAMPYTKHMHIADIVGKVHYHQLLGQGEIDLSAALALLATLGYDGYLSVELMSHSDVWETALKPSHDYLVATLNAGMRG